MSNPWWNFVVIIFVQLILFLGLAFKQKKLPDAFKILEKGAVIGLVFGLLLDHIVGKYLGFSEYKLGFGIFFLSLNALLSYGLFSATVLLFQKERLRVLFVWSILVTSVYEVANIVFPVWVWKLPIPPILLISTLIIGYFGGALIVIYTSRYFSK